MIGMCTCPAQARRFLNTLDSGMVLRGTCRSHSEHNLAGILQGSLSDLNGAGAEGI